MATYGVNFRATAGYVTDPANYTYDLGEAYPVTRGGITFGYLTSKQIDQTRDRDNTVGDKRLAGINFTIASVSGSLGTFQLDKTGAATVILGLGDLSASNTIGISIADSGGTKFSISGSVNAAEFYDGSGVKRTSAADWASNQQPSAQYTFASYLQYIVTDTVNVNTGRIATLAFVEAASTSGALNAAGAGALSATGSALAAGVLSSAGTGAFGPTGAALGAGVLGSAGQAVASWGGAALAAGVLSSAGAATATFVGASINSSTGDFSSAGVGVFSAGGASLAAGAMGSAGSAAVDFRAVPQVEPVTPAIETNPGPGGGVKGGNQWSEAERRRREREERRRDMIIAAVKGMAPAVFAAMSRPGYIHINRTLH